MSTYYKNWIEQEKFKEKHLEYGASNVHYFDLRMSLFYCQKGLCAYTEEKLCKPHLLEQDKWCNGKYSEAKENIRTKGHIEHFDESLKKEKGWLWDNLFMVDSDINVQKGTKKVHYILKPDSPDYDVDKYLQFDDETDTFYPHINLTQEEQNNVKNMIKVLGLNDVIRREEMIENLKIDIEYAMDLIEPLEYPTAWRMTLENLKA